MASITEKTTVSLSIATLISILGLAAGLVPYAQAKIRGIVHEELISQAERLPEWQKEWKADREREEERFISIREQLAGIQADLKYLRPLVGR
jgi:hypothetical protein